MNAWECPRCGTVNAPWNSKCSCVKPEQNHIGINSYPSVTPGVTITPRCVLCNMNHPSNLGCLYPYSLCL